MKVHKFFILLLLLLLVSITYSQEISSIRLGNLKRTDPSLIIKLLDIKEGSIVDSSTLQKKLQFIKRLPAIANVIYTLKPSIDGKVNLHLQIDENKTILPGLNLWSQYDALAINASLYEYNLVKRAILFGGSYQFNQFHSYQLDFKAPYLLSRKFGLGFHHGNWSTREPLYFEDTQTFYKYQNISVELETLYQANIQHQFSLGLTVFNEKYTYLEGTLITGAPNDFSQKKSLVKLSHNFTTFDYFYYLIDGFQIQSQILRVESKREEDDGFWQATSDLFYFKSFNLKSNWASRLRIGMATNNDSPFAPFAADNQQNIRGIGDLTLRGTGFVAFNTEFRHTLLEKKWFVLQSNVFIDTGIWREPGQEIDNFFSLENTKIHSGIGIRFMHKKIYNAIFRVDYGTSITNDKAQGIVFEIGQYF